MKKFKHHIISILFIILMIIFAVATSFTVDTELEIHNNSSSNIKIEISHHDGFSRDDDKKQKLELAIGQRTKILLGMNGFEHGSPEGFIRSLIIYDEIGNKKKEFDQNDFFDEDFLVEEFFVFMNRRGRGFLSARNVARFLLEITDELLE